MQILEGFVFMKKSGDALRFLIILVGMLVVSALVLAVVTAFMLKGHMTAGIISGGVIAAYVVSALLGGFCIGQVKGRQKFLWGLLIGLCYFLVLFLTGKMIYHSGADFGFQTVSSGMICAVAGMIGGMLAPANSTGA